MLHALTRRAAGADADLVPWFPTHTRERLLGLPTIVVGCLVLLAVTPAAAIGEGASDTLPALDTPPALAVPADLGSPSGGASLVPEDGTAAVPAVEPVVEPGGDATQEQVDPALETDGSVAQLRSLLEGLRSQQARLQQRLLAVEAERTTHEAALDAAESAYADHLVALYDADELGRIEALIALREDGVSVGADRAEIIAGLVEADRRIVTAQDEARAAATDAATRADTLRERLRLLGTRMAAIELELEDRAGTKRRRGGGSTEARYTFMTGSIPSIGYWGEASGGGVLSGWMGFVGASVGGIGCDAPDPTLHATGTIEQGEASWYGPGFHGENTASGEVYDQGAMTAAHRTLPFGAIVRVYSNATARCAFVRINDRGPFVDGRVIDLSKAAADAIGMSGTAPVQLEVWAGDQ